MRVFLLWLFLWNGAISQAGYTLPTIPSVQFSSPSPWDQVPIMPETKMMHWSHTINPALILSYPLKEQQALMRDIFDYQRTRLSVEEFDAFIAWFYAHREVVARGSLVRIPVEGAPLWRQAPDPIQFRTKRGDSIDSPAPMGKTRYPIVFLHGLAGRIHYSPWASWLPYWKGIDPELGLSGEGFQIFFTEADYLGDSFRRGPALYRHIQEILQKTGAKRVHLIGHSQGGLDARVLQGGLGLADQIASITTIGTPHLGLKIDKIPLRYRGMLQFSNLLFGQHLFPSLMDFRSDYIMGTFNVAFPFLEGVPFFSYGGRAFDVSDPDYTFLKRYRRFLLRKLSQQLEVAYATKEELGIHDGIVPLDSTRWGQFMGIIEADHFEQALGHGRFPNTDFYLALLDMLRELEQTPHK